MADDQLFADIEPGARITAIRPLPSDPNIRSIFVDGRSVAKLRATDIESLGIGVEQRWTRKLAGAVADVLERNRTRRLALRALSSRALSRRELLERLMRQDCNPATAREIVDELQQDEWLSDAALAESLIIEVQRRRAAGPELLMQKLRDRGIDEDVAQQAIAAQCAPADAHAAATDLAKAKLASMKRVGPVTAARRIAALLARRGFDEETVQRVLAELDLLDADFDSVV